MASPRASPPPRWPASWCATTARQLLELRLHLQGSAERWLDRNPLGDPVVEADEMYQDAGEKAARTTTRTGPPRRRANKRRGLGMFAYDRLSIARAVGRESGEVRLEVVDSSKASELGEVVANSNC